MKPPAVIVMKTDWDGGRKTDGDDRQDRYYTDKTNNPERQTRCLLDVMNAQKNTRQNSRQQ